MSVSGLKKYQIKPLFKVIFTLVRGNWKAGAYGNMDERLLRQLWHHTPFTLEKDQQNRSSVSMTKEVQGRRTHSGSTLIAAIAKYSPSCLLMSSVPPKLTVFSAVSREAKADTAHPT